MKVIEVTWIKYDSGNGEFLQTNTDQIVGEVTLKGELYYGQTHKNWIKYCGPYSTLKQAKQAVENDLNVLEV